MTQEGFTLIEVLIAVTIAGIILGAIFIMLDLSFTTWQRHDLEETWQQEWRILKNFFSDDINNLFISYLYKNNKFSGNNQKFEFLILRNQELKKVSYFFDSRSNQVVRELRSVKENKLLTKTNFFSEIEINNINFFFYEGKDKYWLDHYSYSSDKVLPIAVKLNINAIKVKLPLLVNNIYYNRQY